MNHERFELKSNNFTLIELPVVIAIAILAAMLLPAE
jgi:Tfp pilus assembly protein FimT